VLIALKADMFFWVAGEIACSCNLDRAVFWLSRTLTLPMAVQSGLVQVQKPIRVFVPEATTRLNCLCSSPSSANADDESSPNANTVSKRFFIFIIGFNARLRRNELPEQTRRDK
jgi:hypothetical protein